MAVTETVIPYPSNQKRGVENLLRVDKKFRTYGLEELKRVPQEAFLHLFHGLPMNVPVMLETI